MLSFCAFYGDKTLRLPIKLLKICTDLPFVHRLISIFDIGGCCCRCIAYLVIYCCSRKKELMKDGGKRKTNIGQECCIIL